MSTPSSSALEVAWKDAIWTHATVLAFTPNIFQTDSALESEFDIEPLCQDGILNFILAKTRRAREDLIAGNTRYTFDVLVEYYLQQTDIAESTHNVVRDRQEAVDDLVRTELGKTWSQTVDYYTGGSPTRPKLAEIGGRKCWMTSVVYTAIKTI